MTRYYAFNGDADGLCALQQLRLADPQTALLVTGTKREIGLLTHIAASSGDHVTALDISLDRNRTDLLRLLDAGVSVQYFDHHYAGDIPAHPRLQACIDESADTCTSLLVDRYLHGRHHAWAIVAAYGDNLCETGDVLARQAGCTAAQADTLRELGTCLNYNAYGETLADLHADPAEVAQQMSAFADPLEFAAQAEVHARIKAGYDADMGEARMLTPLHRCPGANVLLLPDAAWARRVMGVLANDMVRGQPGSAIALLSPHSAGGFAVSVRVPADSLTSAADFCRRFDSGGGRRLSGGINRLPSSALDDFIAQFDACFGKRQPFISGA